MNPYTYSYAKKQKVFSANQETNSASGICSFVKEIFNAPVNSVLATGMVVLLAVVVASSVVALSRETENFNGQQLGFYPKQVQARVLGESVSTRIGQLVYSPESRTVYLVGQNGLYGFTSADIFHGWGFSFSQVLPENVAEQSLNMIGTVPAKMSGCSSPLGQIAGTCGSSLITLPNPSTRLGQLVYSPGKSTIYLVGQNGLYGFPNAQVFYSWGYSFGNILMINSAEQSLSILGLVPSRNPVCNSPLDQIAGICGDNTVSVLPASLTFNSVNPTAQAVSISGGNFQAGAGIMPLIIQVSSDSLNWLGVSTNSQGFGNSMITVNGNSVFYVTVRPTPGSPPGTRFSGSVQINNINSSVPSVNISIPVTFVFGSDNSSPRVGSIVNKFGTVYLVGQNGLYGFPDIATFNSWGYSFSNILMFNSAEQSLSVLGLVPSRNPACNNPLDQIAGTCGAIINNTAPVFTFPSQLIADLNRQIYIGLSAVDAQGGRLDRKINWGDGTAQADSIDSSPNVSAIFTQVSHTYAQAGLYTVTLTVADSGGLSTVKTVLVTVLSPLPLAPTTSPVSITSSSMPAGTAGQNYSFKFSAVGGTAPYAWSVYSITHPCCYVTVNQSTGEFSNSGSGLTPIAGTWQVGIKVTDANGQTSQKLYTWVVNSAYTAPATTPPNIQFTANGGTEITVNAGQSIRYVWDVPFGYDNVWSVYYSTNKGDMCSGGVTAPMQLKPWVANSPNGNYTATAVSCQSGVRYSIIIKAQKGTEEPISAVVGVTVN